MEYKFKVGDLVEVVGHGDGDGDSALLGRFGLVLSHDRENHYRIMVDGEQHDNLREYEMVKVQ